MNKVKILHCADLHIGASESFLGSLAEKRKYETLMTFERIVDMCIENRVAVMAISGDLFDSNNVESELVEPVLRKIESVPELKVIYAAGNHDPYNPSSPFVKNPVPDNLYILGTRDTLLTFDDLKLHVIGRSFEAAFLKTESSLKISFPDDDYVRLCVQHGEITSNIKTHYNPITTEYIEKSQADYIAFGHIHKRTDIKAVGKTFFSYCGCPEGQGFDELDEKGVYMGEIGRGECELEFISCSKRMHIKDSIDVSDCSDTEAAVSFISAFLEEKYGEKFRENLYSLTLIGNSDRNVNANGIEARLSDILFYAKLFDERKSPENLEILAEEPGLKGIFVKKMLERINNCKPEEKATLEMALKIGLAAFETEGKNREA